MELRERAEQGNEDCGAFKGIMPALHQGRDSDKQDGEDEVGKHCQQCHAFRAAARGDDRWRLLRTAGAFNRRTGRFSVKEKKTSVFLTGAVTLLNLHQ